MALDKYNAQTKCRKCKKFRWGYTTFDEDIHPTDFTCGTCGTVTENRRPKPLVIGDERIVYYGDSSEETSPSDS